MTIPYTLLLSTLTYFFTIFYELESRKLTKVPTEKDTLLDYVQSSIYSSALINLLLLGLVIFLFVLIILTISDVSQILIAYVALLKFLEFIPLILDIINLLLIYEQHLSKQLKLTFLICLIRLTLNFHFVREKCRSYLERQILVIVDLALFFSIHISLCQYTNRHRLVIVQRLILGLLIFQLNNSYCNRSFWMNVIQWNKSLQEHFRWIVSLTTKFIEFHLDMTRVMFHTRQVCSSLFVLLFLWYKGQAIIQRDGEIFPLFFKLLLPNVIFSTVLLIAIEWDTKYCSKALNKYELQQYCLGFVIEQTCSICYEDDLVLNYDGSTSSSCLHATRSVCNQCLLQHVQTAFSKEIFCPEKDCHVKYDYPTVRKILSFTDDAQLIDRYNQHISQLEIEQICDFIRCSNPLCNVGQINVGGKLNNIVTCHQCHRKTCFTHQIPWHEGKTCEEYDESIESIDAPSRQWILGKSKKCPKCPAYIEKNDGCDHMTCIKCRHEFCWLCLVDFQPIRRDGNHRHAPNCKYYAAYNR